MGEFLYEKRDHIAYITLNCPEKMNAVTQEIHEGLIYAWDDVKRDDNVRVAILTGAGDRAFCSGMDLRDAAETGGPSTRIDAKNTSIHDLSGGGTAIQCGVWKPVVTAVNGVCAGGGLHFVADSDITICAEHATFLDTHVSVGQVSALEPIGLVQRAHFGVVLRMALMGRGERVSAQQAMQWGLVTEVVPKEELMPRAQAIAETLCKNSPAAMIETKRAIWQSLELGRRDALQCGWDILTAHWQHPDYLEGPRAFIEKREPNWVMR
jgi:enoyl-CoA hydratase/carnithine racemase